MIIMSESIDELNTTVGIKKWLARFDGFTMNAKLAEYIPDALRKHIHQSTRRYPNIECSYSALRDNITIYVQFDPYEHSEVMTFVIEQR